MLRSLLPVLLAAVCMAAEDPAIAAARQALAGSDATAKRSAIRALGSKSAGKDDEAFALLIQAVSDRQAGEAAIAALRSRTGLSAPAKKNGGPGYPGYPVNDDPTSWQAWLTKRTEDLAGKAKIKQLEDKTKPAAAATAPAEAATAAAPERVVAAVPLPDDLGKLDRIVLKDGSSLVAYIRSRRTDADGNLVSVRIVHQGGRGEEILAAELIARIEEDVR